MNQLKTTGIILRRTNFGEADRIITLLTPDYGKLRVMARGVRKVKSKLAGGIELFSVSEVSFIRGRGEISTLISTRLVRHYAGIAKDLSRTMLAYELIKQLDKATEDEPGPEYFELLRASFVALDDASINLSLIKFWFAIQLLKLGGHSPNLATDNHGDKLEQGKKYNFNLDSMLFEPSDNGQFSANHIKLLRLAIDHQPKDLQKLNGMSDLIALVSDAAEAMLKKHIML